MAQTDLVCPDRMLLQQFLLGKVAEAEADQVEAHVAHCKTCELLLETLYTRDAELEGGNTPSFSELPGAEQYALQDLIDKMKQLKSPRTDGPRGASTLDFERGEPGADRTVEQTLPARPVGELSLILSPPEQVGEMGRLGGYRVLKILGAGGMGVVFQAEDPQLQRLVALKVMKAAMGQNALYRERFLREARAMAALEHDHVVPIFQVGEDRDVLFLALPLLKGQTLAERLVKQPFLGWLEILRIGGEIARGLAAAHELGIVHRDIKPSNLWLEAGSERVKILDFGLARPATDDALDGRVVAGTPAYMSPEQARSLPLDGRSDLFSLGCVLYRLCTEKPAFAKADMVSLMLSVVADQPRPVREVKPDCPTELAKLVEQLLAKDPNDRPPTASEVALTAEKIRRRILRTPLLRRLKAAAAVVLVGTLAWAGWACGPWLYLVATNQAVLALESENENVSVLVKQGERVFAKLEPNVLARVEVPAGEFQLEIPGNPDGLQLASQALVVGRGGEEKVIVRRVPLVRGQLVFDSVEPLKITLHRGEKEVASLDLPGAGNIELPGGDYEVRLVGQPAGLRAFPPRATIEAGGKTNIPIRAVGEMLRIADPGAAVNSLAVDAGGKLVFAGVADRGVGLWSLLDGKEAFYAMQHKSPVTAVAFSPDGKRALSGGGEKGPEPDTMLRLWNVPGGTVLGALEGTGHIVTCIAFAKDPDVVFSGAGNAVTMWDLRGMKMLRTWMALDRGVYGLAALPDGKRVISCGGNGAIYLWDVDNERKIGSFDGHTDSVRSIAVSADGTTLASGSWDGSVRAWDIASFKELHCFKGHSGWVQCVAISPDGKRLLSGGADKSIRLWDRELREELLRLDGHTAAVTCVAFLPDGRRAVSGGKDQQIRVWKLP